MELGNFVLRLVILSLFDIKVTSNIETSLYFHNNFRVIMYQVIALFHSSRIEKCFQKKSQ